MTKVLKNIAWLLAFVLVFSSCTKDDELFGTCGTHQDQDVEDKELVNGDDNTSDDDGSFELPANDGDIDTDGDGITDDEDDEDDDDGSSSGK